MGGRARGRRDQPAGPDSVPNVPPMCIWPEASAADQPRSYNRTAVLCTTRGQPAREPWTTATQAVDDPRKNVDKPLPHVDEPWATQGAHENHMLRSLHPSNHYILCF